MRPADLRAANGSGQPFATGTGGDVAVPPATPDDPPLDRRRVLAEIRTHRMVHRSLERYWRDRPVRPEDEPERRRMADLHGSVASTVNAILADIVAGRCDAAPPARPVPTPPPADLEAAIRHVEAMGRRMVEERDGPRYRATGDVWRCHRHTTPDTGCGNCGTGGCGR